MDLRAGFRLTSDELKIPDVLPASPYVVTAPATLEQAVAFWADISKCTDMNPIFCNVSPGSEREADVELRLLDVEGELQLTLEELPLFDNAHLVRRVRFEYVPEPASSTMMLWLLLALSATRSSRRFGRAIVPVPRTRTENTQDDSSKACLLTVSPAAWKPSHRRKRALWRLVSTIPDHIW